MARCSVGVFFGSKLTSRAFSATAISSGVWIATALEKWSRTHQATSHIPTAHPPATTQRVSRFLKSFLTRLDAYLPQIARGKASESRRELNPLGRSSRRRRRQRRGCDGGKDQRAVDALLPIRCELAQVQHV